MVQQSVRRALWEVLLAMLVPLMLGSVVLFAVQYHGAREAAEQRLQGLATAMLQAVDRELAVNTARLEALSRSPMLDAGDWASFRRLAQDVMAGVPDAVVAVADPTGQLLLNTAVPAGTPLPNVWRLESEPQEADWEGRRLPVSGRGVTRTALETGRPAYSDLFLGVQPPRPMVAIAVPVRRDGRVPYVLALALPPAALQTLMSSMDDSGARVVLADRQLRLVAGNREVISRIGDTLSPLATQDVGSTGRFHVIGRDGQRLVGALAVSSVSGYAVRASVKELSVVAQALSDAALWSVLMVASALGGIVLARRLQARLADGLGRLADSTRQHRAPVGLRSDIAEIETLREALVRAAAVEEQQREESARRRLAEREQQIARTQAALLRGMLDGLYVFVGVLRPDGVLVEANRPPVELAGLTREQVIGKPFWDCPWWTHDEAVRQRLREAVQAAAQGRTVRYETQVRLAGDRIVDIDFQLAPLLDAEGRVQSLVPSGVDITDHLLALRALRESEERFRALADNIPQLAWIGDADGHLYWFNRRWVDYTGQPAEASRGWNWRALHHPEHVDRVVAKFRQHIRSGQLWEDTFPLRRHDGAYRWFLSRAVPILDAGGRVHRWFGTNTDISDQLQTEHELRQSREQLIARESALRDADRQKDEFLATLAHELRNPLSPIRSAAALIRARSPRDDTVLHALDVIDRQIGDLTHLVDDLLDVSRITFGTIVLRQEPCAVDDIVHHAVETIAPMIAQAGHRLEVQLPAERAVVMADRTRIGQVLCNLLHNAAKFTPQPDLIRLQVTCADGWVSMAVVDRGIGVDPQNLERLFGLFVQEQRSGLAGHAGLGIGLALCRRLVKMHGGEVVAHSPGRGKGSTFELRLPVSAVPAATPADTAPPPVAARRRVLVVDDNRDSAALLQMLLAEAGHEVEVAHDGAGALAACARARPEVVVLDIGLPDMTGYDVARRLRAELGAGAPGPVLIAMTGWGQARDREAAREAGFDHHLTKPADPDVLLRLVAATD